MSSVRWNRRQWLFAGAGTLALAGVLFGAGFATANAVEDSDSDAVAQPAAPATDGGYAPYPGAATGNGASYGNVPATGSSADAAIPVATGAATDEVASRGGGASQLSYPGPGMPQNGFCAAELPDIVSGTTIDVSGAIALHLLGDGFTMRSITVRGEGECNDEGQAIDPYTVVDSSWLHGETGFEAYVTQRPADEPQPNVLTPYNGQVWADGYVYTVWVNAYPIYPLAEPAADTSTSGPDPRGEEVVRAALAQLAPSVDGRCYYVQTAGSWDDLGGMGIGDPRPAIPEGLVEQWSDFQVFTAPPADCNAVELTGAGSFNASFGEDASGGGSTFVSLGAWAVGPGMDQGYGFIDEGSAYWSNGAFSFNVSAYSSTGPLGRETVESIARAMDPNFDSACFVSTRQLDESELAGLGFGTPGIPEGFEVVNSYLNATEAPDCGAGIPDAEAYPQYNLNWSLAGPDGAQIEASAYRYPGSASDGARGYIHETGLNWVAANGTQYSVYGYNNDGTGTVDQELLIEVAIGLDPDLDVSTLEEGPVAMPYGEKPMR